MKKTAKVKESVDKSLKPVSSEEAIISRAVHWRTHALDWVSDVFGSAVKLTQQQRLCFEELSKLISAKLQVAGGHELTEDERDYASKIGISIMSGQGCLAKGTKVLMYDGSVRNVEDIVVGDRLMGDDSECRNVLSLARGREQMYRIKYCNGEYYDVNESHILSLKQSGSHGILNHGEIHNVTVKDFLSFSKRKQSHMVGYRVPIDFLKKELPIPPYIMGLWLGDGCKGRAYLTNVDEEIISEWKQYGESIGLKHGRNGIKNHVLTGGKGCQKPNKFKEMLAELGLVKDKHIPHIYLTSDRHDRLELLAGLIDTDGSIDNRNRRVYDIIQKREHIADSIVYLCRSLGLSATKKLSIKSWIWNGIKKTGEYYRVTIGRNVENIPVRMAKKKAVAIANPQRSDLNYMFSIEKLGVDDYYGFEIDGNKLFVLGDFTVTHNTGKDFTASLIILYFLHVFKFPKILATANTAKQLRSVLWSEISKVMSLSKKTDADVNSKTILESLFTWQSTRLFLTEQKGQRWFAEAVTVNTKESEDKQAEALAGRHEDNMLYVIDEASGVPDPVFRPLEGSLTGKLNIALLIFNPTRSKGFAVQSHGTDSKRWIRLRWNAEESERVTKEQIQAMADKHGINSNTYRIRVLGLPPVADEDTLIPWDWIEDAANREFVVENEPVILGVDVGAGGDDSVIAVRQGNQIVSIHKFTFKDTMQLVGRVINMIESTSAKAVFVDTIGIGIGVYNRLCEQNYRHIVHSADIRRSANNPEKFIRRRDELWWFLREQFENSLIAIPNNRDLIDQLGSIKYNTESSGKIKIEGKKQMKTRGLSSPDEADAVMLTYFRSSHSFKQMLNGKDKAHDMGIHTGDSAWMAA